jgi:hypothetical protein
MSDIQDPLAMPAGELKEPSYPVLSEGVKRMVIQSFEVIETDDGSSKRLAIKLALTGPDKSTEGVVLQSGFGFTHAIFLTPNEQNTPTQIAEQAAMPVKAALGAKTTTSVLQCINNPNLIVGKVVEVKVGTRKGAKGSAFEDRVSNTVKNWIVK